MSITNNPKHRFWFYIILCALNVWVLIFDIIDLVKADNAAFRTWMHVIVFSIAVIYFACKAFFPEKKESDKEED